MKDRGFSTTRGKKSVPENPQPRIYKAFITQPHGELVRRRKANSTRGRYELYAKWPRSPENQTEGDVLRSYTHSLTLR